MANESVTVEHGGVEITTNTMSEADLRAEMEAPPESLKETPDSLKETSESLKETSNGD